MIELNKAYQTTCGSPSCGVDAAILFIHKLTPKRASYYCYRSNGVYYGSGSREIEMVEKWIKHEITKEQWEENRFGPWPGKCEV